MRVISPRYLAEALSISESTLKRWVDAGRIEAVRTDGGHRRIDLVEAVRFIRESGLPVHRPDLLEMPEAGTRLRDTTLCDHLIVGDATSTRGWMLAQYLEGATIAQLADGPVRAAMHEIGERWLHSDDGIFVEHRATMILNSELGHMRSLIPHEPHNASQGVAIGGALAGDPYLLPSQFVQLVLEEVGMRAINLGANTPIAAFSWAVTEHRPCLIWLSITSDLAPHRIRELELFLDQLPETVSVVVGGQKAYMLNISNKRLSRVSTMEQLATIARRSSHRRAKAR